MGPTRIVFVLGMHRSGTSAAAEIINAMGIDVNADDDLLPPNEANPQGYWESESLVHFNDEVLAAVGGHWTCPPHLDPGWEGDSALDSLRAEAGELFATRFRGGTWLWKDPRNCLTLPFWLAAFDAEPAIVFLHRNPLEVAGSLMRRDGFDRERGLALWERYVREALSAASGLPTFVSSYQELVEGSPTWAEQLRAFLASRGIAVREMPAEDIERLVDPDLRRLRSTTDELTSDSLVPRDHVELVRLLDGLRGVHPAFAPPPLPQETGWADRVLLRQRVEDLERELAATRGLLEATQTTVDELFGSRTFRYTSPLRRLAGRLGARGPRRA